ncbi:AAA family ATPase [Adhaeribacter pallidiroseus]|uniref:Nuclease SbcCD subunit n=1 Tax=Adhaeribacter pallidiroseus TaxID=2072847 RepID=A0A369QV56_9BACT|nr:AAA family ATPase [Adhaeribacter pallidiroseus]RDC66068.1 Nuclease SbcCD subunit [Adhaeribacter pallidiroseus]
MKILGVRFLNLNSLKGLHEIRFDQSPLVDAGLFAITGPTGAGKTTLLDAITVGLFGRVHRHDRDAYEIMTRHTGESFSEVDFEVKEKQYRAKWSLYRSRKRPDGKIQPTHMELLALPDQNPLDLKPSEVPTKVTEISGLDYSQFLRSVILSQGDFTRFLKASESERSELLEKITDTGIYSRISVSAYRQADKERKALEQLRAKLNNTELLTEEQVANFQQQVSQLQNQIQEQQKAKNTREQELNWLNRLEQLQQKKTGLAAELQVLEASFEAQQIEFKKLQQHQRALQFKPALIEIKTSQNQAAQLGQDLTDISLLLPDFQKQTREAEQELALAQQQVQQAQQELDQAEPVFHEVTRQDSVIASSRAYFRNNQESCLRADEELKNLKKVQATKLQALQQIQTTISQAQNWLKQNLSSQHLDREIITYQQGVKDLHDINRRLQETYREQTLHQTTQLTANQFILEQTLQIEQDRQTQAALFQQILRYQENFKNLLNGQSANDLENACNALPTQLNLLQQQYLKADQFGQLKEKANLLRESLIQNQAALTQTSHSVNELSAKLQQAHETLTHLQQIVDLQRQIQKYEADRELLQPQQPCPLCGSEHHPFVENKYHSNVTEAEQKRGQQQQVVTELTTQQTTLASRLSSLQAVQTNEQKQLMQLRTEGGQLKNQFDAVQQNVPENCRIEDKAAIQELLQTYQQRYQQQRQLLTNLRRNEEESRGLERKLQEQKELIIRREHEITRTQERAEQATGQLQRLHADVTDLLEQQKAVTGQVQSFLLRFKITFELDKSKAIEEDLHQRAAAFAAQTEQLQEAYLALKQAETEQNNLQETISQKEQLLNQQLALLQQEEVNVATLIAARQKLFADKNPQDERERLKLNITRHQQLLENLRTAFLQKQEQMRLAQSRQQQWQTELTRVQAQVTTLTTQLHHSVQAHNIDSVDTLVQLFLNDDEAHRIELLQKQAERALTETRKLYSETEADLRREQELQLTDVNYAALQTEVERLSSSIAQLHQQIGSWQLQLKQDADLKIKYQETAAQVEIQQKEFLRWDKMAALIGSADGKKFSKFAQGLTLARLTELANRHLLKLNPRYRILKSPTQDLELQIVDTYQADAVRSMNTLSGGESFLVSLALALGLSDLAGRKAQINSLFIDEGFGTLDNDTLDIAISALENLQAGGKSIGIISHVEALKERINTQIQVSKQVGGQSTLKISGYNLEAYA